MRRVVGLLIAAAFALAPGAAQAATNATYFNDASLPAADPYVLHDPSTGYYYAYSTDGADPGSYFGIYRSADLVTWEHVKGGALPVNDPKQWGNDWFWAPEVYRNPKTGLYFLFYAARSDANTKAWFGYADFEEPCKVGVAVSRSPEWPVPQHRCPPDRLQPLRPGLPRREPPDGAGPEQAAGHAGGGREGAARDLHPVHRSRRVLRGGRRAVPLLLAQRLPELELGRGPRQVRRGVQHPRRAAHARVVERPDRAHDALDRARLPRRQRVQGRPCRPAARWLAADPELSAGQAGVGERARRTTTSSAADRRRTAAGKRARPHSSSAARTTSPTRPTTGSRRATASATPPLPARSGPFKKYAGNPILHQDPAIGMYSTGHGSLAFSPDRGEMYYVHHGRPTTDAGQRRLYTERMTAAGGVLDIDQSTSDRPVPSGVAPYAMTASASSLRLRAGTTARLTWRVASAGGASLALANPLNRVSARVANSRVAEVQPCRGRRRGNRRREGGGPDHDHALLPARARRRRLLRRL